jgi:SET domain
MNLVLRIFNYVVNACALQHSDEPNIRHALRKADGTVQVWAARDLKAGEELFNQYRQESDEKMPYHRFFTRYGFVPGISESITNLLRDKSSIFVAQKAEV